MFSSLKIRDFRVYWSGMLISLLGTWIQSTAQSWLIYKLTGSSFLLGLVAFATYIPVFALSLIGGVVADRFSKRDIILIAQLVFMVLAFVLGVLVASGAVATWHIMLLALLYGVVMAFDGPARQSYVLELTGRRHLVNAIALNSVAFNSARIVGPSLAALLISAMGMAGCFFVNAVSFVPVIFALLSMKIPGGIKRREKHILHDLLEGLRFLRINRLLLGLIIVVGIISMFGITYITLMPVFADAVFGLGIKGLGVLMGCVGFGALAAALGIAKFSGLKYKGRWVVFSSLIFSLALLSFAVCRVYWLALGLLVIIGWGSVFTVSLINALLQLTVPEKFIGRVMSVFMLTFAGVLPLGNLLSGTVAHFIGVAYAVGIGAFLCLILVALTYAVFPQIWRAEEAQIQDTA